MTRPDTGTPVVVVDEETAKHLFGKGRRKRPTIPPEYRLPLALVLALVIAVGGAVAAVAAKADRAEVEALDARLRAVETAIAGQTSTLRAIARELGVSP